MNIFRLFCTSSCRFFGNDIYMWKLFDSFIFIFMFMLIFEAGRVNEKRKQCWIKKKWRKVKNPKLYTLWIEDLDGMTSIQSIIYCIFLQTEMLTVLWITTILYSISSKYKSQIYWWKPNITDWHQLIVIKKRGENVIDFYYFLLHLNGKSLKASTTKHRRKSERANKKSTRKKKEPSSSTFQIDRIISGLYQDYLGRLLCFHLFFLFKIPFADSFRFRFARKTINRL